MDMLCILYIYKLRKKPLPIPLVTMKLIGGGSEGAKASQHLN